MPQNPILEEIWQVKEELAREAGYDVHQFFENLRRWSKEHPHAGTVVHNADELDLVASEMDRTHEVKANRQE